MGEGALTKRFVGVSCNKGLLYAHISVPGEQRYVPYATQEEAAHGYDALLREQGRTKGLNFPEAGEEGFKTKAPAVRGVMRSDDEEEYPYVYYDEKQGAFVQSCATTARWCSPSILKRRPRLQCGTTRKCGA